MSEKVLDTSIRLIADYCVNTDDIFARFDILTYCDQADGDYGNPITFNENTKQFNVDLLSSPLNKSALVIPKTCLGGVSMQVNGKELISKLRALADRLEKELPA